MKVKVWQKVFDNLNKREDDIERSPEQELQLGILMQSISDYFYPERNSSIKGVAAKDKPKYKNIVKKEAINFFNNPDCHEFSYLGICESLNLNPNWIMKLIKGYKDENNNNDVITKRKLSSRKSHF